MGVTATLTLLADAIDQAKSFIFVVDWSFHPFFKPRMGSGMSPTIGAMLLDKAKAGLTVAIHTWNHTAHFSSDGQNDSGDDWFAALADHLGWPRRPPKFRWRAGSPSGLSLSHHQKFVVVDEETNDPKRRALRVFFGGLDFTKGRLDWGKHPVSVSEPLLDWRRLSW